MLVLCQKLTKLLRWQPLSLRGSLPPCTGPQSRGAKSAPEGRMSCSLRCHCSTWQVVVISLHCSLPSDPIRSGHEVQPTETIIGSRSLALRLTEAERHGAETVRTAQCRLVDVSASCSGGSRRPSLKPTGRDVSILLRMSDANKDNTGISDHLSRGWHEWPCC